MSHLAAPPPRGTPVPRAIAELAGADPVALVWQNETGGTTARIDRATGSARAYGARPDAARIERWRALWDPPTDD